MGELVFARMMMVVLLLHLLCLIVIVTALSSYVIGCWIGSWRYFFAMKQKCIWWAFHSWMQRSRSQQWSNHCYSISQHKRGYDYWIERIWEVGFWTCSYGPYGIENTNLSCIQVCWVERIMLFIKWELRWQDLHQIIREIHTSPIVY